MENELIEKIINLVEDCESNIDSRVEYEDLRKGLEDLLNDYIIKR